MCLSRTAAAIDRFNGVVLVSTCWNVTLFLCTCTFLQITADELTSSQNVYCGQRIHNNDIITIVTENVILGQINL